MKLQIEEEYVYIGMVHAKKVVYHVKGWTFGFEPFNAGPFQNKEEAQSLVEFLKKGL